jgi:hypothetical protein
MHVQVPDLNKAIGIVRGRGIFGIRGEDEFRELSNS